MDDPLVFKFHIEGFEEDLLAYFVFFVHGLDLLAQLGHFVLQLLCVLDQGLVCFAQLLVRSLLCFVGAFKFAVLFLQAGD